LIELGELVEEGDDGKVVPEDFRKPDGVTIFKLGDLQDVAIANLVLSHAQRMGYATRITYDRYNFVGDVHVIVIMLC